MPQDLQGQGTSSSPVQKGPLLTTRPAKQVWEATLGQLELQVTRPSYETWLKRTVGIEYREGEFIVGTPNAFVAEMLEQRMYSMISEAMERVTTDRLAIQFQVLGSDTPPEAPRALPAGPPASGSAGPQDGASHQPQLQRRVAFNPKYCFETFVVGKSNELAHAAAAAVSDSPGVTYNPLVLYSDVGLGKTHLLHAIGHRIQSRGLSLVYATTEEFTNQYIRAIREGKTEEFRARYRSADALLLDDIQFLIGKEQTQEGFFHTFNALHMANRQVVITCDRPVAALTLLEDRVRSRLAGGLVVDIQPPDLETRLAILRAKAEQLGQSLPAEVLQLLGERVHTNIRELEGTLNRVVAYARLTEGALTVELVSRVLADASTARRRPQPQTLLDTVADYFHLDQDTLKGPRGKKDVALARQVAMYLLKEETNIGVTAIGRLLGGRDHTTVLHGYDRIASRLGADAHLRRDVTNIRQALASA